MNQTPPKNTHWLPDEEYKKAVGQLRLQLNGIMHQFNSSGLDNVVTAIEEIVKLAEDFSLRVRGHDKPISLELIRGKRKRETPKEVD